VDNPSLIGRGGFNLIWINEGFSKRDMTQYFQMVKTSYAEDNRWFVNGDNHHVRTVMRFNLDGQLAS
jgi:hypothetical protein